MRSSSILCLILPLLAACTDTFSLSSPSQRQEYSAFLGHIKKNHDNALQAVWNGDEYGLFLVVARNLDDEIESEAYTIANSSEVAELLTGQTIQLVENNNSVCTTVLGQRIAAPVNFVPCRELVLEFKKFVKLQTQLSQLRSKIQTNASSISEIIQSLDDINASLSEMEGAIERVGFDKQQILAEIAGISKAVEGIRNDLVDELSKG